MNYYNEHDPKAAAWLRELIARGLIAAGDVDERSIEDVRPDELRGYVQCHFFAGIGGWAYALDLAGWPRDRPVWTGSCPCQPFSAAGKGARFEDERHLWPAWQHLIAQCRPAIVYGEQVASKAADAWIDLVQADMEGMDYVFGCVPFPAAGIGAPHIRDRNYWLGVATGGGREWLWAESTHGISLQAGADLGRMEYAGRGHDAGQVAPASAGQSQAHGPADQLGGSGVSSGWMADMHGTGRASRGERFAAAGYGASAWADCGADTNGSASEVNGHWGAADWLRCRDGKWRPVEPGTFPLAHGLPARVVRLRGYGNAIVPQQAAEFIRASVKTGIATVRIAA